MTNQCQGNNQPISVQLTNDLTCQYQGKEEITLTSTTPALPDQLDVLDVCVTLLAVEMRSEKYHTNCCETKLNLIIKP